MTQLIMRLSVAERAVANPNKLMVRDVLISSPQELPKTPTQPAHLVITRKTTPQLTRFRDVLEERSVTKLNRMNRLTWNRVNKTRLIGKTTELRLRKPLSLVYRMKLPLTTSCTRK